MKSERDYEGRAWFFSPKAEGSLRMEKKYQVFISSTYEDLKEERSKVRDAILSMSHFPVGMEFFGAADESQWQIISKTIDSSDFYVLIIGTRYGSVIPDGAPDAGMSYTEKEFRYALEKGVPTLVFIINDDVRVKAEYVEKENLEKLESFKVFATNGRTVTWWKSSDDLANKVSTSLYKQIQRTERPGWIRGDFTELKKSREILDELSERNRQLEKDRNALFLENCELKQRVQRKPMLIVSLEKESRNGDRLARSSVRQSGIVCATASPVVHLKVGRVEAPNIQQDYKPLGKSNIPPELVKFITDEEIRAYNNSLPSEKEIEDYLNDYRAYHMIIDNGYAFKAVISNKGTMKATNVSATIAFPDKVRVFETDDVEKWTVPQPPRKPKDLLKIARGRAFKTGMTIDDIFAHYDPLPCASPSLAERINAIANINAFETVVVSNNVAEIEIRDLIHTKSNSVRGIYLVPIERGNFEAKVSVMCAEYEEPEETTIVFECE